MTAHPATALDQPAPYGPPGPGPQAHTAGPSSLEARVLLVMDLLVTRYQFPVNGAAGLVGNLIAESGVMPNRIEGSHASTPMRAPDFTGRVRDFTPEEARDRDFRRRLGPRLPGVGIAQWTSRERRVGLFQHVFEGRRLGPAILRNLAGQVDYLVTELRQRYRPVNVTLTAPRVSLEQASDAVLLRFEIPAAVLNKPLTDPSVRRVIERRRANGMQALRIYRARRSG